MKVLLFVLLLSLYTFAFNLHIDVCKDVDKICYEYNFKDVRDWHWINNKQYLRVLFYDKRELDMNLGNYKIVNIKKRK